METEKINLASLMLQIPDEEAAYTWLESVRWPNGPVCPHCGVIGHAYHLKPKNDGRKTRTGNISQRKVWKCGDCRKQFTVTVGTLMERSKIPMRKWVLAFHLLSAAKNGMSSHELGRALQISHESAWFMSHRLREAFADRLPQRRLEGVVEADETYVGGKLTGKGKGRRMDNKVAVVTLVERDGEARSRVMRTVNAKNIKRVLAENLRQGTTTVMTDESKLYETTVLDHGHQTVNHSAGEYARGDVHINTAEGFFSQLKRSLDGTHHHVTAQHLHRYVAEFDYRYNTRKERDGERMVRAIRKSAGKRLMYKQITAKE